MHDTSRTLNARTQGSSSTAFPCRARQPLHLAEQRPSKQQPEVPDKLEVDLDHECSGARFLVNHPYQGLYSHVNILDAKSGSPSCSLLTAEPRRSKTSSAQRFVARQPIASRQRCFSPAPSRNQDKSPAAGKPVPVDFDTFWRTPMKGRVFDRMIGQGETAETLRAFLMTRDDDWAFSLFSDRRTYQCLSQYFDDEA